MSYMISNQKKTIYSRIENGESVKISFKYVSDDMLMLINTILVRTLIRYDILYMMNSVLTMTRELVVNALKANAKRVFFLKKNLDINNPRDYRTGQQMFKEQIIGDFDFIRGDILYSEMMINMIVMPCEDSLQITVKNNAPILPVEQERINRRIALAVRMENFGDIYEKIEDDTEGAGLGLVLIIMFLKSMGLDPNMFSIRSDENVTMSTIRLPFNLRAPDEMTAVKRHIMKEVQGIPTFPDNVIELLKMCVSEDADIEDIASRIKQDVAISSDVIKMANSAGFITSKRVDDINKAVVKIGLKNVVSILIASTARKILESRYSMFEDIWEHCNRTAFYSRLIMIRCKRHGDAENAYMAGLLHDLGHVVLMAADTNAIKKISYITRDRKIINSTVMEELAIGISHSEIGALMAEKWNFYPMLVQIIRYHHSPLRVSQEYRATADAVYLANMLCGIEKRKYFYYYIEEQVLEDFGIGSEAQLLELHSSLKSEYDSIQKRL